MVMLVLWLDVVSDVIVTIAAIAGIIWLYNNRKL
jgi:hypothetical protein